MIVRHTLLYSGVKFIPAIATILTVMAFTRLMSPSEFGQYTLTLNVSTTAVAILSNFLVIGLGRFEPETRNLSDRSQLHSTVLFTAIILNISVTSVTFFLAWLDMLPDLSVNYYLIAAIFQFLLMLSLSQKLINANFLPALYGISLTLKNVLIVIFGVVGISMGYGVEIVLLGFAIAALIASLPAYKLWERTSIRAFDKTVLKKLWAYGAPLTFLYLFISVINLSDRLFIEIMLGSEDVGLYAAGYTLTQSTIGIVGSVIHLASFPLIVKAYEKEGLSKAQDLLSTSFRILILLMVPVTLGFLAIRSEISMIFLGDNFSSTSIILMPVLAFSVFFGTIKSYYFDYTFQLVKATWLQSVPPFAAAIINCVLNYVLIPRYGLIGAAYATLISFIFFLAFTAYLSTKIFELPRFPYSFVLKVFLSGALMFLLVSISGKNLNIWFSLTIKVFLGIFVYSISVFFLLRSELWKLVRNH